jgi:hypothetical protein
MDTIRFAFEACVASGLVGDAVDVALGVSPLWRNAASYVEGGRWIAALDACPMPDRERLWVEVLRADVALGAGDPRRLVASADAVVALGDALDEPAAVVIGAIYQGMILSDPDRAIRRLRWARAHARDLAEPQLERLARAFLVVARLVSGDRDGVSAEVTALTSSACVDGYDRYICFWAAWVCGLADRDGPELRRWMDNQLKNVHATGLRENWLTMFCHVLTRIAEGTDWLEHLRRARRRAQIEGRNADADCVLALAYAAACRDDAMGAAELLGASATRLFHDTANFVHHLVVRDLAVRPLIDQTTFRTAVERGRSRDVASILTDVGL